MRAYQEQMSKLEKSRQEQVRQIEQERMVMQFMGAVIQGIRR